MKIVIFGASGGTGRYLVSEGLEEGFAITAFVRSPAKLTSEGEKVKVVVGDVLDPRPTNEAISGQDVVISALGRKRYDLHPGDTSISDGLKNIIAAMKNNGVKRLLFISSFGVSENIFLLEKILLQTVFKNLFADNPTQERLIKESGLDWTIVRPARLTDEPATGKYQTGENLHIGPFSKISRADVADFLIKKANDYSSVGKTFTIRY